VTNSLNKIYQNHSIFSFYDKLNEIHILNMILPVRCQN